MRKEADELTMYSIGTHEKDMAYLTILDDVRWSINLNIYIVCLVCRILLLILHEMIDVLELRDRLWRMTSSIAF